MAKRKRRRQDRTEEEWKGLISNYLKSNLTSTEFCKRSGIVLSSFSRAKNRLNEKVAKELREKRLTEKVDLHNPDWPEKFLEQASGNDDRQAFTVHVDADGSSKVEDGGQFTQIAPLASFRGLQGLLCIINYRDDTQVSVYDPSLLPILLKGKV